MKIYLNIKGNYQDIREKKQNVLFFDFYEDIHCFVTCNYRADDRKSMIEIAKLNYNIYVRRMKYTKDEFKNAKLLTCDEFSYLKRIGLL